LHKPLRVSERGPGRFAVSGSPVDCVYIAMHSLCPRPPDLVVSGINDGYNLGTDVFYSGTVGAAVEGGLRGVVGMAISTEPGRKDMSNVVAIASKVVSAGLAARMPAGSVVNVNIPRDCDGSFAWTHLGKRFYGDDVHEREDPRGRSYFWIGGGHIGMDDTPGTDCNAIAKGLASLTPLSLDRTGREALDSADALWDVPDLKREDS
ncbi:MAG: 5'/3'-nucleotidase SurE, partial [Deltaproteobacteria bacterium]|nr:5'/3'-nucleotidase SurE [Deltaproteobacteria bacterium]